MTVNEVWEIASERLRKKNKHTFAQWFEQMVPLQIEEDVLVLSASAAGVFCGAASAGFAQCPGSKM